MKPRKTWILIASGGEARILFNEGPLDGVHEVEGMTFENEQPPAREIMADKQGRAFDSVGGGRHAMEYSNDPAEQYEHLFARHLNDVLLAALSEGRYDRLAIVAAPSMLAKLRKTRAPAVHACVQTEVDKDYTKTAPADLTDLLRRSRIIT